MKVYSRGEWEHRMKCRSCWSEVGVEMADVKSYTAHNGREAPTITYFATCVVCGGTLYLPMSDIPLHVMLAAGERTASATSP